MKLLGKENETPGKENEPPFCTPNSTPTPTNNGDDFGDAAKRPGSRGRKRKATSGEKDKEPSVASTTAGLLEHLKEEGARKASNDEGVATALNKIAESSALAGKSMQAVADAILALVAQQAQLNK